MKVDFEVYARLSRRQWRRQALALVDAHTDSRHVSITSQVWLRIKRNKNLKIKLLNINGRQFLYFQDDDHTIQTFLFVSSFISRQLPVALSSSFSTLGLRQNTSKFL